MFKISKTFEFCYGHRVWSQTLNNSYSDDLKCACRHLHGHEAKVEIHLESQRLTNGMVTDFRHLEWLKKWINEYVDHRFIIDQNDPLFAQLTLGHTERRAVVQSIENPVGETEHLRLADEFDIQRLFPMHAHEFELLSGFLIVDFVPTSENLAQWMYDIVLRKMRPLADVVQVDWWETPKSKSTYTQS